MRNALFAIAAVAAVAVVAGFAMHLPVSAVASQVANSGDTENPYMIESTIDTKALAKQDIDCRC
jgi:hypothetical protein